MNHEWSHFTSDRETIQAIKNRIYCFEFSTTLVQEEAYNRDFNYKTPIVIIPKHFELKSRHLMAFKLCLFGKREPSKIDI